MNSQKSKDLYLSGTTFGKKGDYARALEHFEEALRLSDGEIWQQLMIRFSILEMHVNLQNDAIEESFIRDTSQMTVNYLGANLDPGKKRALAMGLVSCTLITAELGCLLLALGYAMLAKLHDDSFQLPQTTLSRIQEIAISRVDNGYFPPINDVEDGEAKDRKMNCLICSTLVAPGKICTIKVCLHSFHRSCLQNNLSNQFRPAGLKVHLMRHLARHPSDTYPLRDGSFAHWILREVCDGVLPIASSEVSIPINAKLQCPECHRNLSYRSMNENHLKEWELNEQARFYGPDARDFILETFCTLVNLEYETKG